MTNTTVIITRKGGPEVLQVQQTELPLPVGAYARIRILYCGVGFTDVIMRLGYYPYAPKIPFAPGYEIVGIVDAVGPEVQGFAVGERIASLTVTGGYAEYMLIHEDDLIRVPDGIEDTDAVSAILNYVTAHQMLHRCAGVREGQTVFYTGASGGVGTALLQLGRVAGLEMYGTTSPSKVPLIEQNGGIPIVYGNTDIVGVIREKTQGGMVDASFDGIGGSYVSICRKALKRGGKLVSYGLTSSVKNGKADNATVMKGFAVFGFYKLIMGSRCIFYGVTKLYRKDKRPLKEDLPKVFQLVKEGRIRPLIAEVLPLPEARRANELLERGGVQGKLLLKCAQ